MPGAKLRSPPWQGDLELICNADVDGDGDVTCCAGVRSYLATDVVENALPWAGLMSRQRATYLSAVERVYARKRFDDGLCFEVKCNIAGFHRCVAVMKGVEVHLAMAVIAVIVVGRLRPYPKAPRSATIG